MCPRRYVWTQRWENPFCSLSDATDSPTVVWERAFFPSIHIFTTRCCQILHTGRNDRQPEFTAVCRWNMERETCNRLVIETQWGIIFTVPPAGGCQNPPNQEPCNTLLDDLHGSSSQLKYVPVHVSLFRTSARHSSDLKSNSYISVYFFN